MTARRFMYVSIGLLALATAYNLGARSTLAAFDGSVPGYIIGMRGDDCYNRVGEAWRVTGEGWVRQEDSDLPVEMGEVKFLGSRVFVTQDDRGWFHDGAEWRLVGPFPGKKIVPEGEDWGSQSAHRRNP